MLSPAKPYDNSDEDTQVGRLLQLEEFRNLNMGKTRLPCIVQCQSPADD
jgi:hypothetical protein